MLLCYWILLLAITALVGAIFPIPQATSEQLTTFSIIRSAKRIKIDMKKLIYLASLMALLMVCAAGCGKDKTPTPSSTGTGNTTGGGSTPGY